MADKKYSVAVQRDNDKGGMTNWQNAWLQIDEMSGEVRLTPQGIAFKKWEATLRPDLVTAYDIVMINNPGSALTVHLGGLAILIMMLMSRWTKIPVLKFEQVNAAQGERTMIIRSMEALPRKPTREIGTRIANLLRERGSKIMLPTWSTRRPGSTRGGPPWSALACSSSRWPRCLRSSSCWSSIRRPDQTIPAGFATRSTCRTRRAYVPFPA